MDEQRQPEERMFTKRELDLARLAAFIDGEGTISLAKFAQGKRPGHRYTLQVCVYNSDPRLLLWCRENFGGSIRRHSFANHPGKPMYKWMLQNRQYAVPLLEACMPFFVIKKDQAELGIAYGNTISRARNNCGGAKYEPVVQYREMLREKIVAIRKTTHEMPSGILSPRRMEIA